MAIKKGEKVKDERDIWELEDESGYLVDICVTDPITKKRLRMRKKARKLKQARKWRDDFRYKIKDKEFQEDRAQQKITFTKFADEYYEEWHGKVQPSTRKSEKSRIDGVLKAYFGKMQIHTITRKDIETFLRKRRDGSLVDLVAQGRRNNRKGGVSVASTNRDLCRIKNMFKYAVNWKYLKENPALGIPQEKEKIPEAEYLKAEEVAAFLDAAEVAYRPIFVTAIYTGIRYSKIMGLQWQDVVWDFNYLAVRDPKNDEDRYVPMNKAVRAALMRIIPKEIKGEADWKERLAECEDLVFVNPATGKPFVDVRKAMRRALDKIKVTRHIRFHDLRHTTGSHLAMNGATEREIGEVLGHKDPKMSRRYSHLSPSHTQSVIDRLDFTPQKKALKKSAQRQTKKVSQKVSQ